MDRLFRALPRFKGKARLAKLLFAKAISKKADLKISGKYGCRYIIPNILENVGFDIFINGCYEPEIQELICKLLPRNGCLLDLGANIGSIIVPVCKRRPDIRAVGVEAAPWIYSYLEKNVLINDLKNVQLINNALFDTDNVELDFFSPHDKFGKGSLAPVFTKEGIKVKSKKLDTLVNDLQISRVDVIKIDVEGFEHFVFKGGQHLLSRSDAPIIIFEFVDWAEKRAMGLEAGAAQRMLMDMGYQLYEIHEKKIVKVSTHRENGAANFVASKEKINFL